MNKLLRSIPKLLRSTNNLAWIINLVVVLIIFVLLNSLWWLPRTGLSFIVTSSTRRIHFSFSFLLLHQYFLLLRITYKLSLIIELILLHLIWWWIKYNLFRGHHKSLLISLETEILLSLLLKKFLIKHRIIIHKL